jgi:hypothetical protein
VIIVEAVAGWQRIPPAGPLCVGYHVHEAGSPALFRLARFG